MKAKLLVLLVLFATTLAINLGELKAKIRRARAYQK